MRYLLYLDSRNSTGPRPSQCTFNLNSPIINASQVRVASFVFSNTLFNVDSSNNTLVFSTMTLTIPAGYYTAANLISYINAQCLANPTFNGPPSPPSSPCIQIVGTEVQWRIGNTNTLLPCSAYSIFCLDPTMTYTGNFWSNLFVAGPWALALNSPSLAGSSRFVNAVPNQISSPFYVHHIQSAHGEIESSATSVELQWATPLSHANVQQLAVTINDPHSSRELTEIGPWSALLEVLAFE